MEPSNTSGLRQESIQFLSQLDELGVEVAAIEERIKPDDALLVDDEVTRDGDLIARRFGCGASTTENTNSEAPSR